MDSENKRMWKKIQIKEIYWCWQKIHNTEKWNKTNITETKPETSPDPGGPRGTDSKQPREPLRTSHLIHEDLHLHQPRVGIPRCPVGYHPSKGDQGSGLAAELLRERGRREGTQLSFGSGLSWEPALHPSVFSPRWCHDRLPVGEMTVLPSTFTFLHGGAERAKMGRRAPSCKARLLSRRWMGLPGKPPHLSSRWPGSVLQTVCSTVRNLSLPWLVRTWVSRTPRKHLHCLSAAHSRSFLSCVFPFPSFHSFHFSLPNWSE